MEVCVESFFLQKGDKNVIEFCNRTFDADTHRLKEQTKTCFSHASSREEEHGVVGVFFWRYASDDDDALLFSLSLFSL